MSFLLVCIIVILTVLNIVQYRNKQNQQNGLKYAYEKLQEIVEKGFYEKVLIHTANEDFKKLLVEVNQLIEHNRTVIVEHHRLEGSMKRMLSNISHDLKTPLTIILGNIDVILHEPDMDHEERVLLLEKVNSKTYEVLELIKKFFELVRLESGDKEVAVKRVNISEICRKNMLDFYELVTKRGFQVDIEIPEQDVFAWGNEEELNRILHNLISNALEYGSDGKVIGLKVRIESDSVSIDIWDRGKGINELHIDHVFERMYTLEDSRNKLYQGSGLGLTITKRLVEKLGGEIHLQSRPFDLTVFTVKLNRISY